MYEAKVPLNKVSGIMADSLQRVQMRWHDIPNPDAAMELRLEMQNIREAIASVEGLIEAKDSTTANILEGTERSLGTIDRAVMACGYR